MNKRLLLLSAIIIAFAVTIRLIPFHQAVPLKQSFSTFPLFLQGWSGREFQFSDVVLEKLRVSEYMSREYVKPPHQLGLYIGYYSMQKEGAQIHSPKHCLPGSGWQNISEKTGSTDVPGLGVVKYVESVYQKGDEKEVFVYWYRMKNAYITGDYELKTRMILNSIIYRRNDAAFVRLSAPVRGSVEDTVKVLQGFMTEVLPLLKDYLPD
jgi:EpsI family protein